jgi:hypothetical protein
MKIKQVQMICFCFVSISSYIVTCFFCEINSSGYDFQNTSIYGFNAKIVMGLIIRKKIKYKMNICRHLFIDPAGYLGSNR